MDEDRRQPFSDEFRVFLSGTPRSFAKTAKEHRRVRTLCYSKLRVNHGPCCFVGRVARAPLSSVLWTEAKLV